LLETNLKQCNVPTFRAPNSQIKKKYSSYVILTILFLAKAFTNLILYHSNTLAQKHKSEKALTYGKEVVELVDQIINSKAN
jgi:hypothetical protein